MPVKEVYEYQHVITTTVTKSVTVADIYTKEALEKCFLRYGNRIIDFRPPVKGEIYVPQNQDPTEAECESDYFVHTNWPRFILRPKKKLRVVKFTQVEKKLEKGDYVMYLDNGQDAYFYAVPHPELWQKEADERGIYARTEGWVEG